MKQSITIEANQLDSTIRKKVIFNAFDQLGKNETLLLHNDHDPLPLKKLFEAERPGNFEWRIISHNTDNWQIAITKTSHNYFTLKELIIKYPSAISIFEKYKFDYFQHASALFDDICRNKQLENNKVLQEIIDHSEECPINLRFDEWPPDLLMNFITSNHHNYLKRILPELRSLMHHIEIKHLSLHPEILHIEQTFDEFSDEIFDHLRDEENIVFPLISNFLDRNAGTDLTPKDINFTLNWMREDHLLTISSMKRLRILCNNYRPPIDACPAFTLLYNEMQRFENDLHYHLFLENSVLFPAVETTLDYN